ncbi:patatin-like phospholipase family protein [Alkaliflexus imshenetskii]|uniref:patatin-like phospholipase family protein n=1 Tax=Alkaliflexus imshenetskii TaxID=286730 RepID=UPI0004AE32E8|nr:patatin-like phospholipase family protein [Alkaliflexus imshenetskii]
MHILNRLFIRDSKSETDKPDTTTEYRLGIALSGGSARGFAHIGVLKALEENGLNPEIISGTSMGALVGVLYAAGLTPDEIQNLVNKEPIIKMVRPAWGKNGLFMMDEIKKILKANIKKDDFSALKKPFYLAVSNINDGKREIIQEGPLFDFVMASCAVPVIFAPQIIGDKTYIDGGLYDNLPADAIRDKCQTLIGVHVNYIGKKSEFKSIRDIAERTFSLSIGENVRPSMDMCDYLIDPPKMSEFSFWDFDKADKIIDTGYQFTKKMIESNELPAQSAKTN